MFPLGRNCKQEAWRTFISNERQTPDLRDSKPQSQKGHQPMKYLQEGWKLSLMLGMRIPVSRQEWSPDPSIATSKAFLKTIGFCNDMEALELTLRNK
nr:hypothetical protein [Tanacetum cinerariifolium]